MRRRIAGIGLGLSLALAVPSARAEGPLEPPDLDRYLRWGPVRARPGFVLTHLGYDDNVFFRSDVPPQGDYTATLSPRVDGVVLFRRRAFLTFTEQLDWTVYAKYSDQNYLNQLGSGRLTIPLKRFGLYADFALNNTKDRPADQLDVRTDVRERRMGTGILIRTGWRTDAEIGVLRTRFRYSDPNYYDPNDPACPTVGCRLDRDEQGARAFGRYLVFGRTRLTLELSERNITFTNPASGRDARRTQVIPGVEFGLGGRLTGIARIGHTTLDSKNPSYPDYSGAVGEARLAYRFGAGTTIIAGGKRDVGFSIYMPTGYYLGTSYELRCIQYLTRIFGVEAGASRGRTSFPPPEPRDDRTVQFDGGIRIRLSESALGRKVEYSLKVTHWSLTSTEPTADQSRTVIGFGAVIGY